MKQSDDPQLQAALLKSNLKKIINVILQQSLPAILLLSEHSSLANNKKKKFIQSWSQSIDKNLKNLIQESFILVDKFSYKEKALKKTIRTLLKTALIFLMENTKPETAITLKKEFEDKLNLEKKIQVCKYLEKHKKLYERICRKHHISIKADYIENLIKKYRLQIPAPERIAEIVEKDKTTHAIHLKESAALRTINMVFKHRSSIIWIVGITFLGFVLARIGLPSTDDFLNNEMETSSIKASSIETSSIRTMIYYAVMMVLILQTTVLLIGLCSLCKDLGPTLLSLNFGKPISTKFMAPEEFKDLSPLLEKELRKLLEDSRLSTSSYEKNETSSQENNPTTSIDSSDNKIEETSVEITTSSRKINKKPQEKNKPTTSTPISNTTPISNSLFTIFSTSNTRDPSRSLTIEFNENQLKKYRLNDSIKSELHLYKHALCNARTLLFSGAGSKGKNGIVRLAKKEASEFKTNENKGFSILKIKHTKAKYRPILMNENQDGIYKVVGFTKK